MIVDNHIIHSENTINSSPTLSPFGSLYTTSPLPDDPLKTNDIEKNLEIDTESIINSYYDEHQNNSNECKFFIFGLILFIVGLTMFIYGMVTYAHQKHSRGIDLAIMGTILLLPGSYGISIPCIRRREGIFNSYVL